MRIQNITVDCDDPYPLVSFWAKATDFEEDPENRNEPEDPEGLLVNPGAGPNLLFMKASEPTGGASKMHLDLTPTDRSRDEEVDRLVNLGATLVADHRQAEGEGWVLLADPEGNEFSVGRRIAEPVSPETSAPHAIPLAMPSDPAPTRDWRSRLGLLAAGGSRGVGSLSPLARRWARELRGRTGQLVRLALLVVESLIALRVILKVAGANESAGFANFLYKITGPLVGPFHPVFADHSVNGHPFEVGSLLAMAVYAAVAYMVRRLGRLLVAPRG